jgi:tetratricopeptide (TPR) repeat protein
MGRLDAKREWIVIAALLLCVALLRGPALLSAWYNNLASLTLRPGWQALHRALSIAPCPPRAAESTAAQQVGQALRLNPQSERARLNAARLAWLRGDCEAALEAWGSLPSSDVIARLEHANGLYALGREREALELYRQIDHAAEYLHIRGELAEALQDVEAAIAWYELAIKVLPTQATMHSLATLYVERGQHDAAMAVLDSLSEGTQGADVWLWWRLGQSAQSAGDWEIALRAFEHGALQSDDPCTFWEAQADVLEQLEKWATAETVSLRAQAVCPERLWPYLRLGRLRRQAGDLLAALHWYRQAEELWPEHVAPKYYLGVIHFDQQQYDQARGYFQQVLDLEPGHLWSIYYLAWCSHESGDRHAAVETLARAIALHDEQPWRWAVLLGDWHLELAEREEALAAYRQALSWHPGDEDIQARIESALQSRP